MAIVKSLPLATVPLFAGMDEVDLSDLSACLRRRGFDRGEVIFVEGDPGDSLFVIESGQVKIVLTSADGKEILLTALGPGDFFGDLALLDGLPRSADAIGLEAGQLALLHRRDFLRFLESRPRAVVVLMAVLSRRLRRNAQLIQDAAFLDVPGRLAKLLLQFVGEAPADRPPIARLTQSDLAAMIGATRESVNKALRGFERRGLIRLERGRIEIVAAGGLREQVS